MQSLLSLLILHIVLFVQYRRKIQKKNTKMVSLMHIHIYILMMMIGWWWWLGDDDDIMSYWHERTILWKCPLRPQIKPYYTPVSPEVARDPLCVQIAKSGRSIRDTLHTHRHPATSTFLPTKPRKSTQWLQRFHQERLRQHASLEFIVRYATVSICVHPEKHSL